jgi:hypothetical protein
MLVLGDLFTIKQKLPKQQLVFLHADAVAFDAFVLYKTLFQNTGLHNT